MWTLLCSKPNERNQYILTIWKFLLTLLVGTFHFFCVYVWYCCKCFLQVWDFTHHPILVYLFQKDLTTLGVWISNWETKKTLNLSCLRTSQIMAISSLPKYIEWNFNILLYLNNTIRCYWFRVRPTCIVLQDLHSVYSL